MQIKERQQLKEEKKKLTKQLVSTEVKLRKFEKNIYSIVFQLFKNSKSPMEFHNSIKSFKSISDYDFIRNVEISEIEKHYPEWLKKLSPEWQNKFMELIISDFQDIGFITRKIKCDVAFLEWVEWESLITKKTKQFEKLKKFLNKNNDVAFLIQETYNRFENYIEKQTDKIFELQETIKELNESGIERVLCFLKYEIYYNEYKNIRSEQTKNGRNSFREEKDYFYNKCGFAKFHLKEFAFFVLAYRNINDKSFLNAFMDKGIIDINNLESLRTYENRFYDAYIDNQNKKRVHNRIKMESTPLT